MSLSSIYEEAVTCFGEDRVDIQVHPHFYYLYLHFPKFQIKNSDGLEHIIQDLYVRISFDTNFKLDGIKGTRTFITEEEQKLGYFHSHLDSGYTLGNFSEFCTGYSMITSLKVALKSKFNSNTLSALLFSLEEMLSWESLEGVPYIHIRDLSSRQELNSLNISDRGFLDYYYYFISKDFEYNLEVKDLSIYLDLNKDEIFRVINPIVNPEHQVEYSSGNYYSRSSTSTYSESLGITNWRFKGEFLKTGIRPTNIKTEVTLVAHPHLIEKIYEKFNKEFQTFLEDKLETAA